MAAWPLTSVSVSEAVQSYPTRGVFLVRCHQGTFVAKVDPGARRDVADAQQLHALKYLGGRAFPHVPFYVPTSSGDPTGRICGRTVCVLEYLPLGALHDASPAETWGKLGAVAAGLNAFQDYPVPFAIPLRSAFSELAQRSRGRVFEARFLALLGRVAELERLRPDGLIHGEINLANARRRGDGTIVVIDWDQAGAAPAALEYGLPVDHAISVRG